MNILIDGLHLTAPYLRGVGHYTRIICSAIDRFHVGSLNVLIVTTRRSSIQCLCHHLAGINYNRILLPLPGRLFCFLTRHFDFYLYLKKLYAIDLVHIPFETYYKTKMKNIMTVHGMSPFVNPRNTPFENRFRRNLVASKKYVTRYISVSKKTKEEMIRYLSVRDHDVLTIPIGLDDHFFNQTRAIVPTEHLDIICYGAFETNKNHQNLIKALDFIHSKGLLNFDLTVIGHARWGFEDSSKYLQRPYIRNMGYVSHQALRNILGTASCVIVPSIYEGFGLALVESLAMGVPVLASNTIHALDYVREGYIGFNPFSVEEIINAILSFSKERIKYESEAGRERHRLKHSLNFQNMASLLRDVYQNIAKVQ
jgi:glycosyltransferase involved in cell wall biosynthesis